ncbi:MAG: tetratricopeptide repeat protein [Candidatus Wallbacteria bacterium]|nr:tetratricopeptide repeat protein [Candidatus Wallbacteria bacterium]
MRVAALLYFFLCVLVLSAETTEVNGQNVKSGISEIESIMDQGRKYFLLGDVNTAVTRYQAVISADGEFFEGHLELGRIFFYRSQPALALKHLVVACRLKPDNREAKYLLARVYLQSGESGQGMNIMKDLADYEPAWRFLEAQDGVKGRTERPAGETTRTGGFTANSSGREPASVKESDQSLWEKAKTEMNNGRIERAGFFLTILAKQLSDKTLPEEEILLSAGQYASQLGNYGDAALFLERLTGFSRNPEAFRFLSRLYQQREEFMKAQTVLERALEFFPEDIDFHGNLSHCYKKTGAPLKAIDQLLTVLKLDPENVIAGYNLALLYYENGHFSEAKSMVQQIKSMIPPRNTVYQNILVLERKLEKCLENF